MTNEQPSTPTSSEPPGLEAGDSQQGATFAHSTTGGRVLVIDDEPEIRRAIQAGLAGAALVVEWAPTGAQGLELVARWHPDVVILDLFLPDMDGLEVCRQIRQWSLVPIIVLSVRASDQDKITALELGADDYLTKPFSMGELLARIRVAFRHTAQATGSASHPKFFRTRGLVLDLERRQVSVNGAEVHLTHTQYEVLKYLALHAGKVVTHRTLLRAVWGPQYETNAHYLRIFIGQLRRKLEPDPGRPRYLLTEPGIGYRLQRADEAPDGSRAEDITDESN
ncbi:MAG TPA: response regulator transcription factor [Ktedonobacterales bacterium]|nr:response regulator transcription factor [Ktedonobacterales bacterium]